MPSILKDIFKVLSSNILAILLGILSGFVVPRLLTIGEYATFKTFGLYAGYVGILHFGFIDGIYLKYGGLDVNSIDQGEFRSELSFLALSQLLISAVVLVITLFIGERLLVPVACIILPTNIITFYLFFFQATRQFSSYSLTNVIRPLLKLGTILLMLIIPFLRNAPFMIWAQVASVWLICVLLWMNYRNTDYRSNKIKLFQRSHFHLISVGIFIMLGNLSSMLFYSMDRWFVKFLLPTADFAFYSFATSMMQLVMILISSVAMTFYPLLAKSSENTDLQNNLFRALMMMGALSCSAIFLFKLVVSSILPQYVISLEVIGILMAGLPAIAVINGLYVNLFKAKKIERKYFTRVLSVAGLSFLLNCIAVWINKSNISIAIATTIAFYLWFFISSRDFPGINLSYRDMGFLLIVLLTFFETTRYLNCITGFLVYCSIIIILSLILYKDTLQYLFDKIKKR